MIHSWLIWCARHKRDSSPVKTHRIDPSEFHGRRKKKRKRYKSIPTIPRQKPFNTSSPAHATKCQPVFFPCSVCSLRKFLGRETLLGLSRMARQWCYLSNSAEAYMKFINIPLLGPSLRKGPNPSKQLIIWDCTILYSSYTKHVIFFQRIYLAVGSLGNCCEHHVFCQSFQVDIISENSANFWVNYDNSPTQRTCLEDFLTKPDLKGGRLSLL